MSLFTFYDELYGVTFHLFENKNSNFIKRFISNEYDTEFPLDTDTLDGCCVELSADKGYAIIIVLSGRFDNSSHAVSTLAHECYHAVEFVLRDRGVASNKSTSEAWAYYLSYLMEKFLTHLKSKRKRTK